MITTGTISPGSPARRSLYLRYYAYVGLPILIALFSVSSIFSNIQPKKAVKKPAIVEKPLDDESQYMSPEQRKKAMDYYSHKKAQEAKEREKALSLGKPDPYPDSNSGIDNTENWFKHRSDGAKGISGAKAL